jgi:hypothetical protein
MIGLGMNIEENKNQEKTNWKSSRESSDLE